MDSLTNTVPEIPCLLPLQACPDHVCHKLRPEFESCWSHFSHFVRMIYSQMRHPSSLALHVSISLSFEFSSVASTLPCAEELRCISKTTSSRRLGMAAWHGGMAWRLGVAAWRLGMAARHGGLAWRLGTACPYTPYRANAPSPPLLHPRASMCSMKQSINSA